MNRQHIDPLEGIAFLLRQATARVEAMGQRAIAPLELDGRQYGALALLRHRGPRSQQQLADALHVDRSTMVGLVDDLEARSLVARRRSPNDRRAYAVELSPAGARLQRRAQALLDQCERDFLTTLHTKERQQLRELLQRLRTANAGEGG